VPHAVNPNRYSGDARDFWRTIVNKSLDCKDERVFEDIYQYYERSEAWTLAPGVLAAVDRVRAAGVKVCVVSNFDSRLRPLLA
jgi:FMN phosphatase YigB (HAD superfamily)